MSDDIGTTPRKPLTPAQRLRLFEAHRGLCALCGRKIATGERWRDEHMRALGLGGTNDMDNRAPVHIACAAVKDAQDIPAIAKAKRTKRAHLGIREPKGPPIPGSRRSRWKRKMDGTAVPR